MAEETAQPISFKEQLTCRILLTLFEQGKGLINSKELLFVTCMRAEDRDFFELVILMKKIVLLLLVGPDKSVTLLDSFTHFRVDAAFAGIEAGQRNFCCLEKN